MKWQDIIKRTPRKTATVQPGPEPTVTIEPAEPPGFGPEGQMAERVPEPAEQPVQVHMKDQVMGNLT